MRRLIDCEYLWDQEVAYVAVLNLLGSLSAYKASPAKKVTFLRPLTFPLAVFFLIPLHVVSAGCVNLLM